MNKEDYDYMHELMMQYWRDANGGPGAKWPHGQNILMIEVAIKEFYEEGFRQGMHYQRGKE